MKFWNLHKNGLALTHIALIAILLGGLVYSQAIPAGAGGALIAKD